jgi:hypothetical protein
VRFEVVGAFWGSFDGGESARVHDLSHFGALIEAPQPLVVESTQSVCLLFDGQPAVAEARVRHLTELPTPAGARYLVGVEFISMSTAFHDAVDRLMLFRARATEHQ